MIIRRQIQEHPSFFNLVGSLLLVALISLLGPVEAVHAQDGHTVSGTVIDAELEEPLPGVNVVVDGTTTGTTTNPDGEYELTVQDPEGALRFSFTGYEPQVISIDGRSEINVELESATLTGGELIVVGYATQQRQDLTGSVDVVDVDRLQQLPGGQVTNQLQGLASGVNVVTSGQPGEEPQINIRGFNTFGNNQPLFVVDGVPTQNIGDLNPRDVESMQVLKDAGAASIYGARASNGVVVITTRRGRDDISVQYDANIGYAQPAQGNVWDILSPQEMAELQWMAFENVGATPPSDHYGSGDSPQLPDYLLPVGGREGEVDYDAYNVNPHYSTGNPADFTQIVRANHEGTNWYEEIFSPALSTQHDLRVSGGGDQGNYLFSIGYLDREGTLANTHLRRYSVRANTLFNVNDNIRVGENLSFTITDNPTSGTLGEGTAIGHSFRQQPIIPVYDIAGNFAGTRPPHMGNAANPVAMRERTRNNDGESRRLFGNVFAEIDIFDQLMFRSNFGGSLSSGYWHSFQFPTYEEAENSTINQFNESSWNSRNYTWTNTLELRTTIADGHNLQVVGGGEAYRNYGREVGGGRQGYFSFDPNFTNLGTGSGTATNYSYAYGDAILSLIGRIDYDYQGRYLTSFTVRRDGSSRFLNNQWGTFPALTAGWRISEEGFMSGLDWLNDLKIRGGYGIMGNQLNVDSDNAYTLFASNQLTSFYDITGSGSSVREGFEQDRIGNPDARWERNEDLNVGFDMAILDGQLEATVDFYRKDVVDLLFNPELPGTAGSATVPYRNVASMRNQGIDLSLRGVTDIGDLNITADLNFTSYDNEIVEIADGIDNFSSRGTRFGTVVRNEVGQPISSFFGYDIVGFWNSQDEIDQANASAPNGQYQEGAAVGRFRYRDVTGDGQITSADRTFLGDPNPDFTYGLNLGFNYGGWDLTTFFYGSQGNDIWNQTKWWTDFYASFAGAKSHTALHDSWTPDNQNATAPIQENAGSFSTNEAANSYYVEDGSFLRLKNLQLGYTLPVNFVQQIGAQSLRVYVQGTDLFTITGYSGLDPEIGGSTTAFGIDEGAYHPPRQFTMGVNLHF